jgi:hypothetical protein
VDRVDFEELALKGVDPSMGPKLSNPRSPTEEQKKTAFVRVIAQTITVRAEHASTNKIPLVHPKFVGTSPLAHLESILSRRSPRHRKGFYMWMLLAPLTAPFMLIRMCQ